MDIERNPLVKKACALGCAALVVASCAAPPLREESGALSLLAYKDLPGWSQDAQGQALPAFLKSCAVFERKDPDATFSLEQAGRVSDWLWACEKARAVPPEDDAAARAFFEDAFEPYLAQGQGLFTGYYEAALNGARSRFGPYQTPLLRVPSDLVSVDLSAFGVSSDKRKIVGKVENARLVPYDDRQTLTSKNLKKEAQALAWVDDPVDAFFLEIQGSGRVTLENGHELRIGYAGQNGHPYAPIGRALLEEGALEKPVTMAKIRAWLAQNPERRQEIFNKNPSVVFFKELVEEGPVGAQGVALTPLRSLAVDPRFVPLGTPVWLASEKHARLVVAQDTGGAIKGPVRGDLFWGHGPQAETGAGEMQESGTYFLLLPRKARGT